MSVITTMMVAILYFVTLIVAAAALADPPTIKTADDENVDTFTSTFDSADAVDDMELQEEAILERSLQTTYTSASQLPCPYTKSGFINIDVKFSYEKTVYELGCTDDDHQCMQIASVTGISAPGTIIDMTSSHNFMALDVQACDDPSLTGLSPGSRFLHAMGVPRRLCGWPGYPYCVPGGGGCAWCPPHNCNDDTTTDDVACDDDTRRDLSEISGTSPSEVAEFDAYYGSGIKLACETKIAEMLEQCDCLKGQRRTQLECIVTLEDVTTVAPGCDAYGSTRW